MTTLDRELDERTDTGRHVAEPPPPPGDPLAIGLPCFIVGSIALGLVLIGFVPADAVGASLPIILAATGLGLVVAAIWSAALSQTAVASVCAIFGSFWWSYAILVLGLTHNWFGISTAAVVRTEGLFLIAWLAVMVMLTLATLRLPTAYTLLFTLVDVALALVLAGTMSGSATLSRAAGIVVLVFAVVGVYLYFGSASRATGGEPLPLGRPVLR
jgi:succinate-acetate transporter protein